MPFHIGAVACLHQLDFRTKPFGFSDIGPGFNPESFGFITGCDAAGRICQYRNHTHRSITEFRPGLLLDRSEVRIEGEELGVRNGELTCTCVQSRKVVQATGTKSVGLLFGICADCIWRSTSIGIALHIPLHQGNNDDDESSHMLHRD